ncbi:PREDICTED: protein IN2-1 homolog B isoform X1 [Prunus mume]|uniref:Protein IN2-1 homolog B isoform X1 n=1 Tax=Prunus mume TaxID=102107 RepID=A0ABM1LRZ2_PRUMU|nr:PREDICTED: protein IN2-1 homolog B isoform X1 [Prunus mume]
MAILNVSLRGTAASTSSSSLPSWPHLSNSVPFSLSKKPVIAKFPNTTILSPPKLRLQASFGKKTRASLSATMATGGQEVLPPALTSTSDPPTLFDGKTRLYISYQCPYAQRAWIARNCKGLEENIQLVPIDLQDRPAWYKEKVYPPNKVPSLEHNNKVKGESLDLIRYIDSHFEGPSLFPDDPAKREFAEELLSYTDSFNKSVFTSFKEDRTEAAAGAAFDYIETALSKFEDGPFFLGTFSLVDIAYAPFLERFQPFSLEVKKYDITAGRPKLAAWFEKMNKNLAYKKTRRDPKELVESYKRRFLAQK